MPWSEVAAWCVAAAVGSALLTLSAIRYARRRGLLDQPGERRSHATVTPRGGGIGIVIVCLAALAAIALRAADPSAWWLAATGLLLVAAVGWWDDHRALPAWPRLLAHVAAGLLLALAAWRWSGDVRIAMAAALATPVLVNAWNFMDGIDLLAGTQALLCAVALALLLVASPVLPLTLVLAGACAGFVPFNRPPARIFLGDVGSGALGYLLALLGVLAMGALPPPQWPLLLLPPMAMLVDAGCTLAWRMRDGQAWWQPHVQHAYQRLSRRHGHGKVSLAYAGWTGCLIGFMLVCQQGSASTVVPLTAAALVVSILAWRWLHRWSGHTRRDTDV